MHVSALLLAALGAAPSIAAPTAQSPNPNTLLSTRQVACVGLYNNCDEYTPCCAPNTCTGMAYGKTVCDTADPGCGVFGKPCGAAYRACCAGLTCTGWLYGQTVCDTP